MSIHFDKNIKDDVANSQAVDPFLEVNRPYIYPKRVKNRFEDRYNRSTVYIHKKLMEIINEKAKDEKGVKTGIINKALCQYLGINYNELDEEQAKKLDEIQKNKR